ncbi:hypothetical protein E0500_042335 [Streptomyces sp. KM273126]|uniref:hypothetical protein n=1 Tax=Streptomyces sp. KM273126 TaxID=2545247 RepID=UPI0014050330|nr:hypothetical protein [Streptomyces sp. KM273126]MBA2813777.1 hypothetical protein [Streptomyces sp. KM273126]
MAIITTRPTGKGKPLVQKRPRRGRSVRRPRQYLPQLYERIVTPWPRTRVGWLKTIGRNITLIPSAA